MARQKKDPAERKNRSSTSGVFEDREEPVVSPDTLGRSFIGMRITVVGREVTASNLATTYVATWTGVVESMHINRRRVRLVLKTGTPGTDEMRVIEVV